jgi:shikimate kinase
VDHSQWAHRNVTLICGPPGSGKSTLARQLHPSAIEVEDYGYAATVREQLKLYGRAVYRVGKAPHPNVAVVRGGASLAEREHHESLCRPARTIILLTPLELCRHRITERGRSEMTGELAAAAKWWSLYDSECSSSHPSGYAW